MKKLCQRIITFIVVLSLSFTNNLIAQANPEDSVNSNFPATDKGNLSLLTERVYLAFKAYRTGIHEFEGVKSDSLSIARLDSLRKEGWILNYSTNNERPIRPAIIKKGTQILDISDLSNIPADSVLSIEVMRGDAVSVAKYGVNGKNGIVIRLKE